MDEERMILLIDRFLAGDATTEELAELELMYEKLDSQSSLVVNLSEKERQHLRGSMLNKISAAIDKSGQSVNYSALNNSGKAAHDAD